MVAIKAHFDGKVIVPDEPHDLRPGQEVVVQAEANASASETADRRDKRDFAAIVDRIIAENPGAEPFPKVDATDRRAMQQFIRSKMDAKRNTAK
jgi:hypothetical protein